MKNKKYLFAFLVCFIGLSSCGYGKDDESENASYADLNWSQYSLTNEVPVPSSIYGYVDLTSDDIFIASLADIATTDFNEYVNSCIDAGYTINSSRSEDFYMADNESNINLLLIYSSDDNVMDITITKSDETEESEGITETTEYNSNYSEEIEESTEPEEFSEPSTEATESEQEVVENITIENNEDFAAILTDEYSGTFVSWFYNREGSIIEFDGCIADVAKNGDFDTRYNILVYGCDWDENYITGPNFQFYDTMVTKFGDFTLPSYISAGSNVHVIAKIDEYDSKSDCVRLIPVEVTPR